MVMDFVRGLLLAMMVAVLAACAGGQRPEEASQTTLVEVGAVLADIDEAQAASMRSRSDACESEHLCLTELAAEAEPVVVSLEAVRGTLATWETANDAWRERGERPPDWNAAICRPLRVAVTELLAALEGFGHEVPALWAGLMRQADEVCSLGVDLAGGAR